MLRHLVRKEFMDQVLSLRFLILTVLGSLIIWLSLYSGYRFYQDYLEEYRLSRAWTDRHIQHLQETHSLGTDIGYPVEKPPSPLSIFVQGLDPTESWLSSGLYSSSMQ